MINSKQKNKNPVDAPASSTSTPSAFTLHEMGLNPITLSFPSNLEGLYREDYYKKFASNARLGTFFAFFFLWYFWLS